MAAVLAMLGIATVTPLHAQRPAASATPRAVVRAAGCDYQRCALGISPVWNGLAVVRGAEEERVANLNFFWPMNVEPAFAGDSARTYATRAVRTRRIAATLTDAGGVLMAVAAIRGARSGRVDGGGRVAALVGAGAFALSVPLHFQADGWLSRAVWWHNADAVR